MSDCDSQHDITPAFRTLRQRCSDIGLPTWHFDVGGGIIAEPDDTGEAGVWFTSAALRQRIVSVWRQAADRKETGLVPLMPECWLLPLIPPPTSETSGGILALAMEPDAYATQEFSTLCDESRLDVDMMRHTLAPFMAFHRNECPP